MNSGTINAANGTDNSSSNTPNIWSRRFDRKISKPYPASDVTTNVSTVPTNATRTELPKIRRISGISRNLPMTKIVLRWQRYAAVLAKLPAKLLKHTGTFCDSARSRGKNGRIT